MVSANGVSGKKTFSAFKIYISGSWHPLLSINGEKSSAQQEGVTIQTESNQRPGHLKGVLGYGVLESSCWSSPIAV